MTPPRSRWADPVGGKSAFASWRHLVRHGRGARTGGRCDKGVGLGAGDDRHIHRSHDRYAVSWMPPGEQNTQRQPRMGRPGLAFQLRAAPLPFAASAGRGSAASAPQDGVVSVRTSSARGRGFGGWANPCVKDRAAAFRCWSSSGSADTSKLRNRNVTMAGPGGRYPLESRRWMVELVRCSRTPEALARQFESARARSGSGSNR
jgi:hypothetical protein